VSEARSEIAALINAWAFYRDQESWDRLLGTFQGCDDARTLAHVKTPVLTTHHFRAPDPSTGGLIGAISDVQANHACELIRAAGQSVDYRSFPQMGHSMHGQDPKLFSETLVEWATGLRLL
jgi:hypothetical protein